MTTALPLAAIIGPTLDWVAGILIALAVIAAAWRLVTRAAKLITMADEDIAPNIQYMKILPQLDKILSVVTDLAGQVERNHGSSLRDDMDAVREAIAELGGYARENREAAAAAKQAAIEAQQAAENAAKAGLAAAAAAREHAQAAAEGLSALQVLVGTMKEHAKDDRELARSDRDIARDSIEKTLAKIETLVESAQRTEESGERIEAASVVVAEDLAAAQKRADEVHQDDEPGTAADAASQSPDLPESAGER